MKGKALRKHSLHEKTAASVLLKLFISSNEWCYNTDTPYRMSGTPFSNVNNMHVHPMIFRDHRVYMLSVHYQSYNNQNRLNNCDRRPPRVDSCYVWWKSYEWYQRSKTDGGQKPVTIDNLLEKDNARRLC